MKPPSVLVFDVNETLIDLASIEPLFTRVFGDGRVMREWFGQLVTYSMTLTLSGLYEDFFALGAAVLQMVGTVHGVTVAPDDVEELRARMRTMPAHADVACGLETLRDAGFRLVTLTNSPPRPGSKSPLENADLAGYFEQQLSVHSVGAFKPAAAVYQLVAQALGVQLSGCCMVACHTWDTLGAQAAGMSAALLTRPGNAPLLLPGVPQPSFVAPDLRQLAAQLIAAKRAASA